MVKLNRIYTRTGDDGTTGLVTGARVSKASLRVEAYGAVDEANAAVGLAVLAAERDGGSGSPLAAVLRSVQNDLFDAGADLATPVAPGEKPDAALRITAGQTARLEALIDGHNAGLPALTSFILPGGSDASAHLHLARTVTRRAERLIVALRTAEPEATSREVLRYINRLSDLLFVLCRVANRDRGGDVLWEPGANRRPEK
ncbi:MAG: cob(I)yrinic acid a,c-diamide adenosyltransferase [Phycisphaerales bacterium]|nr:cob(I)yrinic acid a,c-diamide adenosyltransferase [Phycisphaerales bacterium]